MSKIMNFLHLAIGRIFGAEAQDSETTSDSSQGRRVTTALVMPPEIQALMVRLRKDGLIPAGRPIGEVGEPRGYSNSERYRAAIEAAGIPAAVAALKAEIAAKELPADESPKV